MKFAIIIPDGCADHPADFSDGRTALVAAETPNLDALAISGIVGQSSNVPLELSPGSDVATLSLLGYDPRTGYTGRAPLEAAAQGISLSDHDWAFRCNLVSVADHVMRSFTAGHITSHDAAELLNSTGKEIVRRAGLEPGQAEFFPGVSYRNLMLYYGRDAADSPFDRTTRTSAPHDYSDKNIEPALPQGAGSELLLRLMHESEKLFAEHPVNKRRVAEGKLPASQCWLWGQGKRPDLALFAERFGGVRGAMISAVDLLIGIAKLIGWPKIDVPGITGYTDTDYAAKGRYAADALDKYDLVCVHVEAPDEASHEGNFEKKVAAIQDIDAKVLPPILEKLRSYKEWRILISPDHPTQVSTKTHSHGPVPWIVAGSDIPAERLGNYNERTAAQSTHHFDCGWELMSWFTGKTL
ncbi:MAG: cofactor-independent phosphoglycerate mutase [Planctomycetaceae bacterium]|nr:cofactor-independent phosphoglycerate mutase [Planctomycetaceae bacterium]